MAQYPKRIVQAGMLRSDTVQRGCQGLQSSLLMWCRKLFASFECPAKTVWQGFKMLLDSISCWTAGRWMQWYCLGKEAKVRRTPRWTRKPTHANVLRFMGCGWISWIEQPAWPGHTKEQCCYPRLCTAEVCKSSDVKAKSMIFLHHDTRLPAFATVNFANMERGMSLWHLANAGEEWNRHAW